MSAVTERRETGPLGAFPLRLPAGKIGGFVLAASLTPLWWTIGEHRTPMLQRYYQSAYWSSLRESFHRAADGSPISVVYALQVEDGKQGVSLASVADAEDSPERLRIERRAVNPKLFHTWLHDEVYHGSALQVYGLFVTAEVITFLVLLLIGANVDRGRRMAALDGTHRRGTRGMSWQRFNRSELGPLWRLWLLLFWFGSLEAPKIRAAIQRGRQLAATPACYLAAAGNKGKWLRWAGLRWPLAEGPGVAIEIGYGPRAVISEELLPYHLNIFGGTGRGKSTIVRNLLRQIRQRGETFVVHDPKREFFREFYREGIDFAIDPRLEECPYWAMEDEAADEPEATPWASSFFPQLPRSQPFFINKPRAIFAYLMSRYSSYNETVDVATCAKLGFWLADGEKQILRRVMGTEFFGDLNRGGTARVEASDQSQGLFSTLGAIAKVLRMMPATPEGRRRFSLKEWKQDRQGCIFLCSEPETQEAILPLHAAMADMAILHTQAEVRDRNVPRVWFVFDEAATMGRMGQIESGMTKQRASGNPIVLGCHDLPQLEERYGEKGAQTITAQAYTNIVLGTGSEREALHIEKMIGHEEIDRVTENRPWHLMLFNRGHRARSITNQVTSTAPVTAAEIQALPRFAGYMLQEGRVLRFRLRPPERVSILFEPVQRIIPPLIYREAPEPEAVSEDGTELVVCPVDDPEAEPFEFRFFRNLLTQSDDAAIFADAARIEEARAEQTMAAQG